jgi:Response regulator containing a CheY-like receiver domain and an HTH DNA-binding domain
MAGLSNKQIAEVVSRSEQTIKNLLSRLYRRLGLRDRIRLAVAIKLGKIKLGG